MEEIDEMELDLDLEKTKNYNDPSNRVKFGEVLYADGEHKFFFDCVFCENTLELYGGNLIEHLEHHLESLLVANETESEPENNNSRLYCPMEDCEYSTKVQGLLSAHKLDVHEISEQNSVEIIQMEKIDFDVNINNSSTSNPSNQKYTEIIEVNDIKELDSLKGNKLSNENSSSSDENDSLKHLQFFKAPKINDYNCAHCNQGFQYRSNLNRHIRNVHGISSSLKITPNEDGKFTCSICNMICVKITNLNYHMRTKHEKAFHQLLLQQQKQSLTSIKLIKKPIEKISQKRLQESSRQENTNFFKNISTIKQSDIVTMSSTQSSFVNDDYKMLDLEIKSDVEVSSCDENIFDGYISKPNGKHSNNFNCTQCNQKFHYRSNLNRHLQTKHGIVSSLKFEPNIDGKYECSKCDLICKKLANLNLHMMRKHKNYFKHLLISQQQQVDKANELLQKKILDDFQSINGVANDKKSDKSTSFNAFGTITEDSHGNKKFKCIYCNWQIDKRVLFNRHLKSKHGVNNTIDFEADADGNYKCPKCDLVTTKKGNITLHVMRKHTMYYRFLLVKQNNHTNTTVKGNYSGQLNEIDSLPEDDDNSVKDIKPIIDYLEKSTTITNNQSENILPQNGKGNIYESVLKLSNISLPILKLKPSNDGMYKCKKCNLTCSRKSNLHVHLKRKHFQYFMKLIKNQEQNINADKSDTEVNEVDIASMNFQCNYCSMKYNRRDNLNRHLKIKHGILTTLNFQPNSEGKYECRICQLVCEKKVSLHFHMQKRHFHDFNKLLKKEQEEYNIFLKSKATRKINHPKSDLNFSEIDGLWHCPQCNVVKSREKLLRDHIREKHMKNCTCHLCGKELASSCSLRTHLRTHQDPEYKCNFCNKLFAQKHNLQTHIRIHMGIKKYNCNYCDKSYVSLNEKKSHEKRIHIKEKTHQCDTCGSSFYTATRLKYHIQRHTGEKPFQCEVCFRRFYDRRLLRDHMVSHSSEKPFACDMCDSSYPRKVTLINHRKKQHFLNVQSETIIIETLDDN